MKKKNVKDKNLVPKDKTLEKYRSKSIDRKLSVFQSKYGFSESEILTLKRRFTKITKGKTFNRQQFSNSLGVLGLEYASFIADRIFDIIDENHDGNVEFDEFVAYMSTLIYGTNEEKAHQSFKIIDQENTGYIEYKDVERMVYGITNLWNFLNGTRVIPTMAHINSIFESLRPPPSQRITRDQ